MCTKNYILLNRSLLINDLWNSEPFTRGQAWVDLLLNTNWKDGIAVIKGVHVPVKRGQACRSIKQLAIRWKWSEGKVKRYLELLVSLEQISYEIWSKNGAVNGADNGAVKSGITTLITIINYDIYQINRAENEAADDAETERRRSADGAQTETYKKEKKGEEGEKEEKQQRLSPQEVREHYMRYAGILQPPAGLAPLMVDIANTYTAEVILEAFQQGVAQRKKGSGYLGWCMKRMEGKAADAAKAAAEAPTTNELEYLKSLGYSE